MAKLVYLYLFIILWQSAYCQEKVRYVSKEALAIPIKWAAIAENFSFSTNWEYPIGVELKADGKAGCADGGFCPERCYAMLDSNGIVLRDSAAVFYQLLDTTHIPYSIACEAACYEWDGINFIDVYKLENGTVNGLTATNIATHCSLQLLIANDTCKPRIVLNSIVHGRNVVYNCTNGSITIDKKEWDKGTLKAVFNFHFKDPQHPEKPIYWKGKIYAKIQLR